MRNLYRNRRALAVLGVIVAATAIQIAPATAAPTAPTAPSVEVGVHRTVEAIAGAPRPSAAELTALKGIKTDADLAKATPALRTLFLEPASVERILTVAPVETSASTGALQQNYGGNVGTSGCYNTTADNYSNNAIGSHLARYSVTELNWCPRGSNYSGTPGGFSSENTWWGWSYCNEVSYYSSWIASNTGYGVGGYGKFAYADTCFSPVLQLRAEVQTYRNGDWYWWT